MSARLVPAASNALMLKHLASEGFDSVYLDNRLLSTQLLGTRDTALLSASLYLHYVQTLSASTSMNVIADLCLDETADFSCQLTALKNSGCTAVVVSDAGITNTTLLNQVLLNISKAFPTDELELIVKLEGFVKYGLNELETRIGIAKDNGIDHIIISNITDDDLVIIKAVQNTAVISLIIDNAKISYYSARQFNPKFILDTYHVYQGLVQSAGSISRNMILKLFIG
ncbi:hypothetical protein [Companilactobacillus versmoldensis]|uniref:Uncharacterized protein n=1 Tax=Companilactobacillus versmoldensis DSM 14857 = KCTC 3814 TaxID=1423815 RepID=A0A0R1SDV6_9LACO|nr:hypothetical protein [Companilactobacillus versmoldensis]KRL67383.1 hypothetical protein FC27_GL001974 [Companilactobacillus versmoldensis DSM 14857 = KCTC 3814]